MFEKFTIFCGCYSEILEFLERDEGVFYLKVKKESKNTSIQARTSREKNAKILTNFQIRKQSKFVSIITFRNRGFVRPALDRLLPGGSTVSMPILGRIGDDWRAEPVFLFFFLYLLLLDAT